MSTQRRQLLDYFRLRLVRKAVVGTGHVADIDGDVHSKVDHLGAPTSECEIASAKLLLPKLLSCRRGRRQKPTTARS